MGDHLGADLLAGLPDVRAHRRPGGHLPRPGELSNNVRQFPRGQYYYIYGGMFLDYLARRFGREKIVEICHEYGSAPIPYGMNRTFKKILGEELNTLYDDWRDEETTHARAWVSQLEREGLTSSRALTTNGENKGYPIFDLSGEKLIVAMGDGEERSGLFLVDANDGRTERLALGNARSFVSQDRSGQVFYTRFAPYKQHYKTYTDIFSIEQLGDEPRRLTTGRRAVQAAISPDGTSLAYVENEAGTTRLLLADERGHPVRSLIDSAPGDQVFEPSWSPDGTTIAAVLRHKGRPDLFLIDVESGALTRLTDDWRMETRPVFDPSGRYLLFSSDLNGINNIYAFDLKEGIFKKLTNVVTGPPVPPSPGWLAPGVSLLLIEGLRHPSDPIRTGVRPNGGLPARRRHRSGQDRAPKLPGARQAL